jgi:cardiolipin synthase
VDWDSLGSIATWLAIVDAIVIVGAIPWILSLKREPVSALAWSLVVILLPVIGFLLFLLFGYTHVYRPLKRKRRHHRGFEQRAGAAQRGRFKVNKDENDFAGLGQLAVRLGATPPLPGNQVMLYSATRVAHGALLEAIADARDHIHLEYYIVQPDETGRELLALLTRKARQGCEVRLLYDALGSWTLKARLLRPLHKAGGKSAAFLGISLLRRRLQVNMRNHRKLVVIDGRLAFTGGMNIGNEYLGLSRWFRYWRDNLMRLEGPAVGALQSIFVEDWDFSTEELLDGPKYFPEIADVGESVVQVIDSGPDQEINTLREVVFAALTSAKERLWIATPYFVPDTGILDALKLAARRGVKVRLLCPKKSDNRLADFASRYYWHELLVEGVKIHEYQRGMMHAKMMLVDDRWGWVGTANLDRRSLQLNFENVCILHSPPELAALAKAFQRDMRRSKEVSQAEFEKRPALAKFWENTCRLFSPVL